MPEIKGGMLKAKRPNPAEVILKEIVAELARAQALHPPMNSAHEGYAVILEELDELKEEVWKKERTRDRDRMRREALQVATVAIRFILDVCEKGEVLNAKE